MCAYRDASAPRWEILSDSPSSSAQNNEDSESERVGRAANYSLPKRRAALPPAERPQKFARTDTSRRPGMPSVESGVPSSTLKTVLESRPSTVSPSVVKRAKKKVVLTRNRELIHSLLKLASPSTSNGVPPRTRNTGTRSKDVQVKLPGNPREVIVLSSDDDTPGHASNPIVLESDDEVEPHPKERVPAITPFLDTARSTSSPDNSHLRSPTSLAGPRSPQRGSSPPMSSESEESVLAVLTTAQGDSVVEEMSPVPGQSFKAKTPEQPPPSPQPSMHSVMRVDSPSPSTSLTVRAKVKTQPRPQSPGYDPNDEGELPSGPPLSPSLVESVPQIGGTSHSPTTAHVSVSSSPSRRRDTPAGAPTGSPPVPVRGTLYSGPLGLWKNFYKAATDKPVSAPGSSRDILPHSEERVKKRSGTLRAGSPSKIVSLNHPSLLWKKPVGTNPAQSSVVKLDPPGSSTNRATPQDKSKSSVTV
ncbi:hypothetical protein EDB92DRAFT_148434 [Lactarius akahatsu]|uniref:Uncharacterized protein n=1 Tax=Lactarius akahatsu TaxID=416441 RepID=A0AAD4QFH0_9AGAM|nr:hypothetical protein EDB92DRAFT_148434 [Lactarius akahatsu]